MPAHLSSQPQHQSANRVLSGGDGNRADHHFAVSSHTSYVTTGNGAAVLTVQTELVLRELARLVAGVIPPAINLRVEVPADLWPILGDPGEIHQALINVLLNARAAMPGHGELSISARNATVRESPKPTLADAPAPPGDYVEVAISHSGSAIYESPLGERIGLRLAQVARMVCNHRGFARIRSRAGEPTTVSLHFPRARSASAQGASGTGLAETADGTILVVDDEPAVLALSREILARAGYRVLLARDGREALTHFTRRRSEIRLVLTDLAMPGMNGFTLMWALRRSKPDLRLIVATGQSRDEYQGELSRLGVRQVLEKPFPSRHLLDAVVRALAEPVQCEPDMFLVGAEANER